MQQKTDKILLYDNRSVSIQSPKTFKPCKFAHRDQKNKHIGLSDSMEMPGKTTDSKSTERKLLKSDLLLTKLEDSEPQDSLRCSGGFEIVSEGESHLQANSTHRQSEVTVYRQFSS